MTEARDVLTRPAPPPTLTVRYGPLPDHLADVWLPTTMTAPAPLVLFLHGGFWRQQYDRTHTAPLAAALAAEGYAVATPEYRRTSLSTTGWPGTFLDVAAALDALPTLIAAATDRVDPTRLCYAGHSAGGHLALWATLRHHLPPAAPAHRADPPPDNRVAEGDRAGPPSGGDRGVPVVPRGVLALAPVSDLVAAYRLDLDGGAVHALLGAPPDAAPDRYAATDPGLLPAPDVPVTLLHGTADARVPIDLSRRYADRIGARLVELPGVDHFALIDPLLPPWRPLLTALATLLAADQDT
jgi:pimeloyl-ACP methyl ester carboxylesterase